MAPTPNCYLPWRPYVIRSQLSPVVYRVGRMKNARNICAPRPPKTLPYTGNSISISIWEAGGVNPTLVGPRWSATKNQVIISRWHSGRLQAGTGQETYAHFEIPHAPEGIRPRIRSRVSRRRGTTVSPNNSRVQNQKVFTHRVSRTHHVLRLRKA